MFFIELNRTIAGCTSATGHDRQRILNFSFRSLTAANPKRMCLTLLPAAPYETAYVPERASIGFAFAGQSGWHAFASDRQTPFARRPYSLSFTPAGCEVRSRSAAGGEYLLIEYEGEPPRLNAPLSNAFAHHTIAAAEALRRHALGGSLLTPAERDAHVRTLSEALAPDTPAPRGANWMTPRRFGLLTEMIEANLETGLTVGAAAQRLELSESFLNRAFRAHTGKPLHAFILDRMLDRARRHLTDSDMGLAEIASASGFSSQAHMTHAFSRKLGIAPGALRQNPIPGQRIAGRTGF